MVYREFDGTVVGKAPRGYSTGRPNGSLIWIVWHTTEGSESLTAAEDGNAYDHVRADSTSTHVFCDGNSVVQEVNSGDRAWAALEIGNNRGYQVELCGHAAQTVAQWADSSSASMLLGACQHVARVCLKYDIPPKWLTKEDVLARRPGMITHKNVTEWLKQGTHTDPGPNFPYTVVAGQVAHWKTELGKKTTAKPLPSRKEYDMRLIKAKDNAAVYLTDGRSRSHVAAADYDDLVKAFGAEIVVSNVAAFGPDVSAAAVGEHKP